MGRWSWVLTRIVRQIWFRAAIISVLSVALALAAGAISRYLPDHFGPDIGQDSVGTILQIMASSMLAVTTFSLTAMVSAYASATQLATPRATQLMISDPTSQNALSTFLGAFIFSIVGIIGLQTSGYGHDGRIILFGATVLVVVLVVVTLLRWIAHITAFGRMADVIDRVEAAATAAMTAFAAAPDLHGRPAVPVPDRAEALTGNRTGYVTHVDVPALGKLAVAHGLIVHVASLPGAMVHPARPLMWVEGNSDDMVRQALACAFTVERHRTFDQDPRLGLIALAETASRALSPAINDPGTAIEVLNALLRVFLCLGRGPAPAGADTGERPPVHVPQPLIDDMLDDAFRPLVRDGGNVMEVAIRFASTLAAVDAGMGGGVPRIAGLADQCRAHAMRTIDDPEDRATFAAAFHRHWPERGDGAD